MKTLILLVSYHHGNTRRVVETVAGVLEADIREPNEVITDAVKDYDLIGFASGVYFDKMEKRILGFAERLPEGGGKRCFVLTTSGGNHEAAHDGMKKLLTRKGYAVAGEWNCRAFDTFGPLALIGGIHKGKPNERDVASARSWAETLKSA